MSTGLHTGRDLWAGFRAQIQDQKVEPKQVSRTVRDTCVGSTFWFDLWVRKANLWSHARGMACTALKTLEANHAEAEARRTQNIYRDAAGGTIVRTKQSNYAWTPLWKTSSYNSTRLRYRRLKIVTAQMLRGVQAEQAQKIQACQSSSPASTTHRNDIPLKRSCIMRREERVGNASITDLQNLTYMG